MLREVWPTVSTDPPNATVYCECRDFERLKELFGEWADHSTRALREVFGTDWPGEWYVSHTLPGYVAGEGRYGAGPRDVLRLVVDGSLQGYVNLSFGGPESGHPINYVRLRFDRFGDNLEFLMLYLAITLNAPTAELRATASKNIVEVVRRFAKQAQPTSGEVSPTWSGHQPSTRLDVLLRRSAETSASQANLVLRGYEWVTFCPTGLAQSLGGAEKIKRTGAFDTVIDLSSGLVLQATPRPEEFDEAAAWRVWEVLRPGLPAGMPKPVSLFDFRPLVMADAADRA